MSWYCKRGVIFELSKLMQEKNFIINEKNLFRLGIVITIFLIIYTVYHRSHEQYVKSTYLVNKEMYRQCAKAESAKNNTLTADQLKECDSVHKLVIEYEAEH